MLEVFRALAARGQWLAWPALVVCALGCALFVYAAAHIDAPDSYFTNALLSAAWGLLVFVFIRLFPSVPDAAEPNQRITQRFRRGAVRLWFYLLAFSVLAVSIAVLWLTVRML